MGQANKRGTFEQRVAMAIARNKSLNESFNKMEDNNPLKQHAKRHGMQKTASRMTMLGMIPAPSLSFMLSRDKNNFPVNIN